MTNKSTNRTLIRKNVGPLEPVSLQLYHILGKYKILQVAGKNGTTYRIPDHVWSNKTCDSLTDLDEFCDVIHDDRIKTIYDKVKSQYSEWYKKKNPETGKEEKEEVDKIELDEQ